MAIVIPSKNIYDLSNPKVRDNVYKKVEINANKGVADNKFDVRIGSYAENTEDKLNLLNDAQWIERLGYNYVSGSQTNIINKWASALVGARGAYTTRTLDIDITQKNAYVSYLKILSETPKSGVDVSLQCKKYLGTGVATVRNGALPTEQANVKSKSINYRLPETESPMVRINLDDLVITQTEKVPDSGYTASAGVDLPSNNDMEILAEVVDNRLKVTLGNILFAYEKYWGTYTYQGGAIGSVTNFDYDINITAERYEPILMEISFQGNTIGIDFEKETISIGEQTSKNALSIDENELIQNTNTYYPPFKHYYDGNFEIIELGKTYSQKVKVQFIYNGTKSERDIVAGDKFARIYNPTPAPFEVVSVTFTANSISEFYKHILDEYKNGKETATLTCTMSQYLDTSGEVAIDAGAYNLVDFAHCSEDSNNVVFDPIANEIRYPYTNMLSNLDFSLSIDGTSSAISIVGSRYEAKTLFSNKSKITIWATMFNYEGEEYDYTIHIDPSYLPSGKFSLSFEMNVFDGVVVLANVQINKGKARPYQKPVRMHFSEGDIVIPMKYTSSGTDVGISLYNNDINTPKQFKVTGVGFFYDGVTRQKLTLQEV